MSEFAEQKWVRVMADHSAEPIWDREGLMVYLDELPVSPGLIRRLRDWSAWYEKNRDWDGDHSFDFATFAAVGLEIARSVKSELQGWTVFYFDEGAYHRDRDAPRETFEYEILYPRGLDETRHLMASPANAAFVGRHRAVRCGKAGRVGAQANCTRSQRLP